MRVEPLGDKVVIKRLDAETKTAGGIVLPGSAQEKPRQGRVLSVGDGRSLASGGRAEHQVREGDRVIFASYAGTEIMVDEEELLIMSEDDILASPGLRTCPRNVPRFVFPLTLPSPLFLLREAGKPVLE